MKIDVIMGGPGKECAVSRRSGTAIAEALTLRGHDVQTIDLIGEVDPENLRPGALVFNAIHGTYGEDGVLQALLDSLGKAYVGSDAAASRLCMDKAATKKRLGDHGLRVPWGVEVQLGRPLDLKNLCLPNLGGLVLKPADEGSSIGLRMVANSDLVLAAAEELLAEVGPRRYLIEEQLPGPEYTVSVIDEDDKPRALPAMLVEAKGLLDYQAKYHAVDTVKRPIDDLALSARLGELAVRAHVACGCRDLSRSDIMRTGDGDYAVLEINTLPGMTSASLLPKAAAAAGILFDELVERLAACALRRGSVR